MEEIFNQMKEDFEAFYVYANEFIENQKQKEKENSKDEWRIHKKWNRKKKYSE